MFPLPSPLLMVGGGAGAPSSSKWRLNITQTVNGASGQAGIAELEMRSATGGADECSGGAALASSQLSAAYTPAMAFANDGSTTYWVSSGAVPQWLEYDFASPKTIVEIAITSRNDQFTSEIPQVFDVQYYDGATWQTYWSIMTGPFGQNMTRVINKDDPSPDKKFWRILITAVETSGQPPSLSEIQMRQTSGGANACTGGGGFSDGYNSSFKSQNAFDGSNTTFWVQSGAGTHWIGYAFANSVEIVEVVMRNRADSFGPGQSPKDFDIQYWSAGSWTTAWSVSGEPAWAQGETRTYTKP